MNNIINTELQNTASQQAYNNQIVLISFGLVASVLLLLAFLPQTIMTIKTKNTVALSTPMFSLVLTARFLFSLSAILLIARYILAQDYGLGLYASSLPLLICHGINLILNGIILVFKIYNVRSAKKHQISEAEWIEKCNLIRLQKKKQ